MTWNPDSETKSELFERLTNDNRYKEFVQYVGKLKNKPFSLSKEDAWRQSVIRFPPRTATEWQKVQAGTLRQKDNKLLKSYTDELEFEQYEAEKKKKARAAKPKRATKPARDPAQELEEVETYNPDEDLGEDEIYAKQLQALIDQGLPVDFERDWEWAYANFPIKGIEPKSAPSASAWKLLRFAQEHQAKFVEKFLSYFERKRKESGDNNEMIETDQRTQFAALDRFARHVTDSVDIVVGELMGRFPDETILALREHGWSVTREQVA